MLKFHFSQGKPQPIRLWYWMLIHVWPFTIPCWPAYHVLVFVYPYSWYAIFHSFFAFEPCMPWPTSWPVQPKNKAKKPEETSESLTGVTSHELQHELFIGAYLAEVPQGFTTHPPLRGSKTHWGHTTPTERMCKITVITICTWRK